MKIDISDLIHGQQTILEIDATIEDDYISGDGFQQRSPIQVKGFVANTTDGLVFDLTTRAEVEQECSRCTKKFVSILELSFTEEMELTEEQKNKSEQLDLTELIRDNILVQLPTKTLCREDCKGLCPVCGKDRNEVDCTCESEQFDPRLSVLSNLLNEDE
ncbi:DUF177 domain-containing protein [Alkalibacter rhizosphaerae]|uniref:DUF177 domain-containing protein n=1 Tax=Alkalibacter rhizosphaerae TaxID=2815577 RepID=A0A974XF63_9FIRM|nr:DUF177 domain-containing protein [Alkalibacter rhizosphaerae]QSX08732.1 DUF177 domain-containing protein [Alkalibacter rhizosphaerae]